MESHDNIKLVVNENNNIYDYVARYNPYVVLLTPCYGGLCTIQFTKCLIQTFFTLKKYGISVQFIECAGDSLVSRARNNLIAKAMAIQGCTHIMFIDGDIEWDPIDIVNLILKDKEVVGGCYPKKHVNFNNLKNEIQNIPKWIEKKKSSDITKINTTDDGTLILNKLLNYNINYLANNVQVENNLIKVKHIATGFLLMKRCVLEKMMKHYTETKYTDDVGFLIGDENKYAYALFDCQVRYDHYLSEDWLFCERWSDIGGECYMDITINLNHVGTMSYNGSLLNKLLI